MITKPALYKFFKGMSLYVSINGCCLNLNYVYPDNIFFKRKSCDLKSFPFIRMWHSINIHLHITVVITRNCFRARLVRNKPLKNWKTCWGANGPNIWMCPPATKFLFLLLRRTQLKFRQSWCLRWCVMDGAFLIISLLIILGILPRQSEQRCSFKFLSYYYFFYYYRFGVLLP